MRPRTVQDGPSPPKAPQNPGGLMVCVASQSRHRRCCIEVVAAFGIASRARPSDLFNTVEMGAFFAHCSHEHSSRAVVGNISSYGVAHVDFVQGCMRATLSLKMQRLHKVTTVANGRAFIRASHVKLFGFGALDGSCDKHSPAVMKISPLHRPLTNIGPYC